MITSQDEIDRYIDYNIIYVPLEYNNRNYKYTLENETLTIITNQNCTQNYNSTYCNCYKYNVKYNILMNNSQCNNSPSNNIVTYESITSDINYSEHIRRAYNSEYNIMYGVIIIAILIATLFKRNSRNI